MKVVFDTNILIDFLRGLPQARDELAKHDEAAISIVTWMEVLVGVQPSDVRDTLLFLETFSVLPLDENVAMRAVSMRREHRLKLPDAIVWASADVHSLLLVTRNTRDFPPGSPGIRNPYTV